MGKRRSSRELALKFLYQFELNQEQFDEQIEQFWDRVSCKEEVKIFSLDLIKTTLRHKSEIDRLLTKYSENWTLDRMGIVDRNILRLGACELCFHKNIPPKVAIDEAVEIAKKYGGGDSPDFINGILDRIKSESPNELPQPAA